MTQHIPIPAEVSIDDPTGWVRILDREALEIARPLIPIVLNGQLLVLFRDEEGELGLIGRNCPHRVPTCVTAGWRTMDCAALFMGGILTVPDNV